MTAHRFVTLIAALALQAGAGALALGMQWRGHALARRRS
jgi:hypothetical protein